MVRRRKVFLHVGMPGAGDIVETATVHHREALFELGIDVPARSAEETFLAALEIRREHQAWGFRRPEVEGQWAALCRRVWDGRHTGVISAPLLATASPQQVDLLLDGLAGLEVNVVVTAGPAAAAVVRAVAETWGAAVRRPERLHVLQLDAPTPERVWKAFGRAAGFGTASLRVDALPPTAGVRSVTSLDDARREIERLARRNRSLERWRVEGARSRSRSRSRRRSPWGPHAA